jgi:hypothetical protein
MALRINKSYITPEQKNIISNCLLYTLDNNNFFANNSFSDTSPTIIPLFLVDGNDVLLPYIFGRKLTKKENINKEQRSFEFKGSLFQHQIDIFKEAIEKITISKSIILSLYPGFGKTIMGAAISSHLKKRTIITIVQTVLPKQWIEAFGKFTTSNVIVFDGKTKIKDEHDVVIVTVGYIEKIPPNIRKTFGTLIIDEAHSFCTKTRITSLLNFEPEFIIAETATFDRPDGGEVMMKTIVGLEMIHIPLKKQFKVIKVNTNIKPESKLNARGKVDWNHLIKSLVSNSNRNDLITSWILNNINQKSLLLTDRKELITEITKRLDHHNIKYDFLCGNKKTYSDSPILLGTYSKIGVGFDEKNACPDFSGIRISLVYMCFSTKQHWLLEQSAGRGFRSDFPTIVDFVDDHKICQSHYKKREKWYTSRGGEINIV